MKRIALSLLFLPVAVFAQVSNPGVRYVAVAPSGSCSASPPVQVVVSTGVLYTCNNGTWASQAGEATGPGGATNSVQYNDAGDFGGIPTSTLGILASDGASDAPFFSAAYSVYVTDPPYNAKCDGSTDDSAAWQAALNSGVPIVALPSSASGDLQQCNFATTLTVPTGASVTIQGGYGELDYTGTGTALLLDGANVVKLYDLELALTGTGTPVGISFDGTTSPNGAALFMDGTGIVDGQTSHVDLQISNNVGFVGMNGGNDGTFEGGDVDMFNYGADHFIISGVSKIQGAECQGSPSACLDLTAANALPIYITGFQVDQTLSAGQAVIACSIDPYSNVIGSVLWNSSGGGTLFAGNCLGPVTALDQATFTSANYTNGLELPPFSYSVAGTPLPSCTSDLAGVQLQVSDATLPTFLGTYTGGGAVQSPVLCNGTNWVTF